MMRENKVSKTGGASSLYDMNVRRVNCTARAMAGQQPKDHALAGTPSGGEARVCAGRSLGNLGSLGIWHIPGLAIIKY